MVFWVGGPGWRETRFAHFGQREKERKRRDIHEVVYTRRDVTVGSGRRRVNFTSKNRKMQMNDPWTGARLANCERRLRATAELAPKVVE